MCLDLSTHQDILSALSHLSSISAMASTWGDNAILAFASIVEALIHLRETSSAESIEQAQRALAVARSSQLDPVVGTIPQLAALTHFADLSCTFGKFDSTQAMSKMQAMQATLEHINDGQAWTEDGSFSIPIAHPGSFRIATQSGIIRSQADGKLVLMFNWMPKDEIYVLGFLLSSIAIAHRNSSDGQKAEQMLKEGIRMQESQYYNILSNIYADPYIRKFREDKHTPGIYLSRCPRPRIAPNPKMPHANPTHLPLLRPHLLARRLLSTHRTQIHRLLPSLRNPRIYCYSNSLPLRHHRSRHWPPHHCPLHLPLSIPLPF